ncbi:MULTISPECIES: RluA family pseudouridine synthase [unclassified Marivivens]|jgi:23S rRNA pseudouridine1911/1915/1917 synthase|uniref:RluA family pseudouridine synthase n=1 Tax=unclassified Marivivens TaxID=2622455 RepID=UPI0007FC1C91|nr:MULTISPECIES: RluA family pseudouridine synthase [unclassified Marivivens]APO87335.1 RNA pseudouridine synthase [Marivivens sp. JLT3646]NVJ95146.1 RluA family pseudouridine synthase [Marivivens sp.]NVK06545.1 RluA family pseudouridine synthase [Marivivens sp.]OBR35847.1 RNA pseudouridine synthase [Donghicola sp. JL3646]
MAHTLVSFTIAENPPPRLDKALSRDVPAEADLSRSRLGRLIETGAVTVNGAVVENPRFKVSEGDEITVTVEAATESDIVGEDIPLVVVYEDDDLIVIDKPAGMVVHPAPGTPNGTVVNALIHHCGDSLSGVGGEKRPGIVHRIDKDTSGLLVAAKSDRAHHGLAAQFEDHSVNRRYLAICYGAPDQNDPRIHGVKGTNFEPGNILKVQTFLGRHKTDRQRQAVSFTQGRHAVTRARIIESLGVPPVAALLECWLETGRTHQIRVHMAHVGHSLIGDPVYGGRRKLNVKAIGEAGAEAAAAFSRQALHAATLGFEHPVTGEWIEFESDLPEDMQALLTALGGS